MAHNQKHYDTDYKIQSVDLAKEIGLSKATREGRLVTATGSQTPGNAMSLVEEIAILREQNKKLSRENKRLKEENEFLEEASAFFAASRWKSVRTPD